MADQELCYGCLFCKTGSERWLADKLEREKPDIRVIVPTRRRLRRKNGGKISEQVIMFPGYLFFCAEPEYPAYQLTKIDGIYRVLEIDDLKWHLQGRDLKMAELFFEQNGLIDLSKAYYEGNRVRIVDGFLKHFEGQIIRIDRRHNTAQIALELGGNRILLWMGFELIEEPPK